MLTCVCVGVCVSVELQVNRSFSCAECHLELQLVGKKIQPNFSDLSQNDRRGDDDDDVVDHEHCVRTTDGRIMSTVILTRLGWGGGVMMSVRSNIWWYLCVLQSSSDAHFVAALHFSDGDLLPVCL